MLRHPVYLVGAGPGAADIVTARGLQLVRAADVVIYDRLVHPRLLHEAPPGAERIDVGPAAPDRLDQQAICFLVAEKAREGKLVVRLKWGDPFVFDLGGVEALFLHEQQIPFEVVPGVPAAIGIAAYAGIPLTHPGAGDTLTLVRGHEDEGRGQSDVDWQAVARLRGTIASYTGPRDMSRLLDMLLGAGRPAGEPAAIVTKGTLTGQETWEGTLGELAARVKAQPPAEPSMLIVGESAALRSHLRWFDSRPLFGRRVLVTRSREQAGELSTLLETLGADAIEAPLIRIVAPESLAALDASCRRASTYDWIVFTSVNGVQAFMERVLATGGDARRLGPARVCAVGPGTAARLRRYGIVADLVPDDHRAEGVAAALTGMHEMSGARVLFPKSDIARDVVPEALTAAGAAVDEVVAYRTVTSESDAHLAIYGQLLEGRIDVVTFSSASAVRAFVSIYGADQAADLLGHTVVAAIGPVTADAALRYGIAPAIVPTSSTVPALVDAIAAHFRAALRSEG